MCPTAYLITFVVALTAKIAAVLLVLLIIWLWDRYHKQP